MHNQINKERKSEQELSDRILRLLGNDDFIHVIMEHFIKEGIINEVINMGLDSSKTIDQLKARQTLHGYLMSNIVNTNNDIHN